jgi:hypothetical protein
MDSASWRHDVIESKVDALRRYFAERDVSRLNSREDVTSYYGNACCARDYRNKDGLMSRGYIVFEDIAKER